jgi:aminoglycoside phosphotransferase (APT) family kinase protein
LEKLIRRGKNLVPAIRAAARAVAAFHGLDAVAPVRQFSDDVARLREAQVALHEARPDLTQLVSDSVEAVIAGLDQAPTAIIHGDLKPEHILVEAERIALIDFDLAAAADPIIDVAHLLAYLGRAEERSLERSHQPVGVAQGFVEEYFALVPEDWQRRLQYYHAMTSIHKAVGLCRKTGAGRQSQIEAVLREGQAFLEADPGSAVAPSFKRRLTRPTMH